MISIPHVLYRNPNVFSLFVNELPRTACEMNVEKKEKAHFEKQHLSFDIFRRVTVCNQFLQSEDADKLQTGNDCKVRGCILS